MTRPNAHEGRYSDKRLAANASAKNEERQEQMNIYVGNLPYNVRNDELREAFEEFGTVDSAEVIFDRRTKRSRGYGFVEMSDEDEARDAIQALNGTNFQGRELRVDESKPKSEKEKSSQPRRNNQAKGTQNRQQPADNQSEPSGLLGFVKKIFG
ncbi:MAG: RNA recognition motif domain-containing protein [Gammaproteobacteria bacterium]